MMPAWALSASEIISRDEIFYSAYSNKPAPPSLPGPTSKVIMDTFNEDEDERQPKPPSSFFGSYGSYLAMPEKFTKAMAPPLKKRPWDPRGRRCRGPPNPRQQAQRATETAPSAGAKATSPADGAPAAYPKPQLPDSGRRTGAGHVAPPDEPVCGWRRRRPISLVC